MARLTTCIDLPHTRILHNLSRCCSARTLQIEHGINTFDAILRNSFFSLVRRCFNTANEFIQAVMSSGCYYDSVFFTHYNNLMYAAETQSVFRSVIFCICACLFFCVFVVYFILWTMRF